MANVVSYLLLALRILSALTLYAFLAGALYLMWRALVDQARVGRRPQIPAIQLNQQALPDLPETLRYTIGELVVGREAGCEVVLPNETISGRHARLRYAQKQWWIEDLGSRNGTKVNGITLESPLVLTSNDLIQLGEIQLTVFIETHEEQAT